MLSLTSPIKLSSGIFTLLLLLVTSPFTSIAKPWREIIPLRSTRADVERILGKPVMDRDVYDSTDGRAIISYSAGNPCEEGVPGIGNIPRDTVIEIYITLKDYLPVSDVLVSPKDYAQVHAVHTMHIYY